MLGVGHIHIGDDVHNPAVRLLRQALVLAAVAGLHMEDGNMQTLCTDDTQAAVGVAQHQHSVRLDGDHQLVALGDNVAHGFAQICAYSIHIDFRVCQLQIVEEHTIQVIVVVLTGVRQDDIEIFAGLIDDRCQTDDFRTGANNNQQLQLAIILK